jgi:hypothetical protein
MSYVLVNKQSQVRHNQLPKSGSSYKSEAAAKAALTRYRGGPMSLGDDWCIMSMAEYQAQVPMMTVTNLMTGKPLTIPADTPWACNPSSETYWSM